MTADCLSGVIGRCHTNEARSAVVVYWHSYIMLGGRGRATALKNSGAPPPNCRRRRSS